MEILSFLRYRRFIEIMYLFIIFVVLTSCNNFIVSTPIPVDTAVASPAKNEKTSTATNPVIEPNPTRYERCLNDVSAKLQMVVNTAGHLWIWDGTQFRRLAKVSRPREILLSPDGQKIAFRRELIGYTEELWVTSLDIPEGRLLLNKTEMEDLFKPWSDFSWLQMAWMIDNRTLLMNEVQNQRLFALDTETGQLKIILEGQGFYMSLSPDGNYLAMMADYGIQVFQLNNLAKVAEARFPPLQLGSEQPFQPDHSWDLENERFLFSIPTTIEPNKISQVTILALPLDGSPESIVKEIQTNMPDIKFSQNLTRIAYYKGIGKGFDHLVEIHIADLKRQEDIVVFSGEGEFIEFSPDSTSFILAINQSTPDFKWIQGKMEGNKVKFTEIRFGSGWWDADHFLSLDGDKGIISIICGDTAYEIWDFGEKIYEFYTP